MADFGGVGGNAAAAHVAQVDGDIRAGCNFIQSEINDRVGRFDQYIIVSPAVGIGTVLVMCQNLGGTEFVGVPRKFIDGTEVGI